MLLQQHLPSFLVVVPSQQWAPCSFRHCESKSSSRCEKTFEPKNTAEPNHVTVKHLHSIKVKLRATAQDGTLSDGKGIYRGVNVRGRLRHNMKEQSGVSCTVVLDRSARCRLRTLTTESDLSTRPAGRKHVSAFFHTSKIVHSVTFLYRFNHMSLAHGAFVREHKVSRVRDDVGYSALPPGFLGIAGRTSMTVTAFSSVLQEVAL